MKIDYIVPLCNVGGLDFNDRIQSLKEKLLYPKTTQLIFVQQIIDSKLPRYSDYIKDKRINWITVSNPTFNKPWLQNLGVIYSLTDYIILAEADCVPDKTEKFFKDISNKILKEHPCWFWGWNRIIYQNRDRTEVVRDDVPRRGMAEGGIVIFNRKFYNEIGCANEFLQELGCMDNEIIRRAEHMYKGGVIKHTIYHRYHEQNYMKINNWKESNHRDKNKKIYNYVCKNIEKTISFLCDLKQGQMNGPVCNTENWIEG